MFTVKATYRNEIRRFTFPDSVLFPTYEELHNQLYRVFPISHNYYLSRLIFSPDASKPGRILVGKEVHSAEDYDSCVLPLRRLWPNPLLRFTIFDETPHKLPRVASEQVSLYSAPTVSLPEPEPKLLSPVVPHYSRMAPLNPPNVLPPPLSPFKTSPAPLPSIFFSPPPSKLCSSREPCCPVAKSKADIEVLLSSFKDDLERILCKTFGTSSAEKQTITPVNGSTSRASDADEIPVSSGADTSRWCFVCRTSFTGVWYGCVKCPWHAICPSCFSKSHSAHTLSFGPSHIVQQCSTDYPTQASTQEAASCNTVSGICQSPGPSSGLPGGSASAIHRGVICDSCSKTIVGVRHKCLDCPDYDLCTACIKSGATEKHNPFHEFFDIEIPGRVYVHTVVDGDRDRSLGNHQHLPGSIQPPVTRQGPAVSLADSPVRHSATCNLCDSAIVGERYKCVICPDFDTCSSCFRITTEQHPSHGFVRVNEPRDLMMRDSIPSRQVAHLAACNSCRKTIYGVRYKCMHSSCPDFDLCGDCEAFPIPVHPLNHPMLKLKTSDALIPAISREGQRQIVDELFPQVSAPVSGEPASPAPPRPSPAILVESPELVPVVVSTNTANLATEEHAPFPEEFLSPLDSPTSDVIQVALPSITTVPSHLLVDLTDPIGSPRSTQPAKDVYHQLLPIVNQEMMHLNVVQAQIAEDPVVGPIEDTDVGPTVPKSFVEEEPLLRALTVLSIPHIGEHYPEARSSSPAPCSNSIGDAYRTPSPSLSSIQESYGITQPVAVVQQEIVAMNSPQPNFLNSTLVGDANVPGRQIFPPGAEFVKGWRVANSGKLPWPTTTEVQFVAGEMFSPESSATLKAKVGVVHPGQDLDIWTGDLKAPDVPGRYVGYWRLNDGQGNFFGSSMWIDLTVADRHCDEVSEHSLAASSMVMPGSRPTNSVSASDELPDVPQPSLPSSKTVTDEVEDPVSDVSSVSLVSVPTSDDEDAEWQDTRTHSEPLEYVVLYDSKSEE